MNRRTLLAGSVMLTACAALPKTPGYPAAATLDTLISDALARLGGAPGLAVAAYARGSVYARGFGVADLDTGEAADADTAFYIASSTKPLTALAIARFAERRGLSFDAPLTTIAPDAPFPASVRAGEVTLRHLLAHMSGISNDPISFRVAFSGDHDPDLLWGLLAASEPNAEAPLGTFDYTNTGYNIATLLIARAYGADWRDLLDTEIFAKCGMTRSAARISKARAGGWRVARPHALTPGGVDPLALEKGDSTMHSAGGVIMSARDAARWLELLAEDGLLGGRRVASARLMQGMRAPLARVEATFEGFNRRAYGLGWYQGDFRGEPMAHHFGAFAGARAHVSFLPQRRAGVAVFANEAVASGPFTGAIADLVYDLDAGCAGAASRFEASVGELVARRAMIADAMKADGEKRARRAWSLSLARDAYVGRYANPAWGDVAVTTTGESMVASCGVLRAVAEPFERPETIRVEMVPGQGELISFELGNDGPVRLEWDGRTYDRVAG